MLIRALAVISAGGLFVALWSVRRMLAVRREADVWARLDDRTERWP